MSKFQCCGTDHPHCHCHGDKGHNILPGCPGYVDPNNVVRSIFQKEYWANFWDRVMERGQ